MQKIEHSWYGFVLLGQFTKNKCQSRLCWYRYLSPKWIAARTAQATRPTRSDAPVQDYLFRRWGGYACGAKRALEICNRWPVDDVQHDSAARASKPRAAEQRIIGNARLKIRPQQELGPVNDVVSDCSVPSTPPPAAQALGRRNSCPDKWAK